MPKNIKNWIVMDIDDSVIDYQFKSKPGLKNPYFLATILRYAQQYAGYGAVFASARSRGGDEHSGETFSSLQLLRHFERLGVRFPRAEDSKISKWACLLSDSPYGIQCFTGAANLIEGENGRMQAISPLYAMGKTPHLMYLALKQLFENVDILQELGFTDDQSQIIRLEHSHLEEKLTVLADEEFDLMMELKYGKPEQSDNASSVIEEQSQEQQPLTSKGKQEADESLPMENLKSLCVVIYKI